MATARVIESEQVALPKRVLEKSHIKPGTELVILADNGRITLVDRQQLLRERMKQVDAEMRARLRKALAEGGEESFFAGLSHEEYLALSEEEDRALWDRLYKEAEREVSIAERPAPSALRSARQRSSSRGAARPRTR